MTVTERVAGRHRAGKHRKVTSWWSNDVKEAVIKVLIQGSPK